MKTFEIINTKPILEKLISQDLPIATAFKLKKLVKEVEEVLSIFEEKRKALFDKYGKEEDVDGETQLVIPNDSVEKFNEEMQPTMNAEIEIKTPKVKVDELEGIKISTSELLQLEWLIEE